MHKYLLSLFILVFIQGCAPSVVPLRGKYQQGSVKSKIEKPFEQVWESVIDLIAETGVAVKMIDRSSGLVIADVASFSGLLSYEDTKGNLTNPGAYIAVERMSTEFPSSIAQHHASAIWNMRIKAVSDNTTIVSVNLHSIRIEKAALPVNGQSTGNFEKMLIDDIVSGTE